MKVYLSHSIRGKKGDAATNADMRECCNIAIAIGNRIRAEIESLDLYIPGEHEFPPVGYLLKKGYITVEQILEIDNIIIDECEAVIIYVPTDDELQGGRKIEYDHAMNTDTPILVFDEDHVDDVVKWLVHLILRG